MTRVALSLLLLNVIVWGQANAPKSTDRIIKGAPAPSSATAAPLASVTIVKRPDGKWMCQGAGGRPCSEPERQAATTVNKSRSNVKNNMVIAPDGSIQCVSTVDNKPCADAVFQDLSKAITKGGSQGY